MFKVQFKGYRYNTGSGDNGVYTCEKLFKETELIQAQSLARKVQDLIGNPSRTYTEEELNFMECFGVDYIVEFTGIFSTSEVEVS